MVASYSLMALGTFGFAYLLVGPTVLSKAGVIITAAVLAPGITLGIVRQIS
jgi:hypothetical protein